jgi:hypothetical protein
MSPSSIFNRTPLFFLAALTLVAAARAADPVHEIPGPVPSADLVPAEILAGPLHQVAEMAQSDGLRVRYVLNGPGGTEEIGGTQALALRVREINAVAGLRAMNRTEEFGRAALRAGGQKLESVADAVRDPVGTAQRLPQGASRFFGRVGNAVKGVAQGKVAAGDAASAALGVERKKAELALRLGVSPFTSDLALRNELRATAQAMAGGALVVSAAGLMLDGGVGTAVSVVNLNETFQRALVESTPQELMQQNRLTLAGLGADSATIDTFLRNPAFDPWQKARITAALQEIGRDPTPLLAQAGQAVTAEDALYFVQVARLYQWHHGSTAAITGFREVQGLPCATDEKGTLVVAAATDLVQWTPMLEARTREFRAGAGSEQLVFITDGQISPRAVEGLGTSGVTVRPLALGPVR